MIFEEIQQRLDQDLEEYKDDEEREREEKKHHPLISVKCCKQDSTVSLVSPSVTKQMGSV
jgi:hypothetical protein